MKNCNWIYDHGGGMYHNYPFSLPPNSKSTTSNPSNNLSHLPPNDLLLYRNCTTRYHEIYHHMIHSIPPIPFASIIHTAPLLTSSLDSLYDGTKNIDTRQQNNGNSRRSHNRIGDINGWSDIPGNWNYRYLINKNISFYAVERGLLENEYCPDYFRYLLFFRNPINVIKSKLSSRNITDLAILQEYIQTTLVSSPSVVSSSFTSSPGDNYYDKFLSNFTNMHDRNYYILPKLRYPLLHVDNYFTRFLSFNSTIYYASFGSIRDSSYQIALKNLKTITLVFTDLNLMYHLNSVGKQMNELLGWDSYHLKKPIVSKKQNSHGKHNISNDLLDFIIELNKYDLWLYQEAYNLFITRNNLQNDPKGNIDVSDYLNISQ